MHALGLVLYRLMIGRAGLDANGRPEERRLRDPVIAPELRAMMLRALAPDPEHRHESVAALGQAVRDVLAATSAGAPRAASRVALGVAIAVTSLSLIVAAEHVAGDTNQSVRRGEMRSLMNRSVEDLEARLPQTSALRASVLATMGNIYDNLGLDADAEGLYARAGSRRVLPRAAGHAAGGNDAAARKLMEQAAEERRAGNALGALVLYERALDIYARAVGPDDRKVADCVREIADTAREIGNRVGADDAERGWHTLEGDRR